MPPSDFERNLASIELHLELIRHLAQKEGFTEEDIEDLRTAWEDIRDRAEAERRRLERV